MNLKCHLCGHIQELAQPLSGDDENLPCGNCGNLSCDAVSSSGEKSGTLEFELEKGQESARAVAKHLSTMRADMTSWEFEFEGSKYKVTVEIV